MTARSHLPSDRPLLRLFNPDLSSRWTLKRVYDELRTTQLKERSAKYRADCTRWLDYWHQFEGVLRDQGGANERMLYPLATSDVSSRHLTAFQTYLQSLSSSRGAPLSASTINKAVGEIRCLLELAAQEGVECQTVRSKRLPTATRPRYYLPDEAIERLWTGCEALTWPPRTIAAQPNRAFRGTGVDPCTWWRALIVLLRCYGARVQDFVGYEAGKPGLRWRDVSFDARSPNPESLESWSHGWLYYKASKTAGSSGREYYLPILPSVRGALERLRGGAIELHGEGRAQLDAPIFSCPRGNGLTARWKDLQRACAVATRTGALYQLEDFRKTVATYSATVDPGLPYALCGWGGTDIARRHYQQPEPLLIAKLPLAPLPACFASFCP